jgi:hypothetical protein
MSLLGYGLAMNLLLIKMSYFINTRHCIIYCSAIVAFATNSCRNESVSFVISSACPPFGPHLTTLRHIERIDTMSCTRQFTNVHGHISVFVQIRKYSASLAIFLKSRIEITASIRMDLYNSWDTMLQAISSLVWFPMRLLNISVGLILPAALWTWNRPSL